MAPKVLITGAASGSSAAAVGRGSVTPPSRTRLLPREAPTHHDGALAIPLLYGEVPTDTPSPLRLYGLGDQPPLSELHPHLADGAIAIIHLLDASLTEPAVALRAAVGDLCRLAADVPVVIGLDRAPLAELDAADACRDLLEQYDLFWPVVEIDLGRREDLLDLVEIALALDKAKAARELQ